MAKAMTKTSKSGKRKPLVPKNASKLPKGLAAYWAKKKKK